MAIAWMRGSGFKVNREQFLNGLTAKASDILGLTVQGGALT